MCLIGRRNQLDAVFSVEGLRRMVVDVGEVGQRFFRVLCGRLYGGLALRALVRGEACLLQLFHHIAAQLVEGRAGDEPGLTPLDGDCLPSPTCGITSDLPVYGLSRMASCWTRGVGERE